MIITESINLAIMRLAIPNEGAVDRSNHHLSAIYTVSFRSAFDKYLVMLTV